MPKYIYPKSISDPIKPTSSVFHEILKMNNNNVSTYNSYIETQEDLLYSKVITRVKKAVQSFGFYFEKVSLFKNSNSNENGNAPEHFLNR